MNFLAHCFLSCREEHLLVGNYLADFLNLKEAQQLTPEIQQGISLHRAIDRFTDEHPAVRQSILRLRPFHRKYAPVISDIFYDYLLAKNWQQFSKEDLRIFVDRVYRTLLAWTPFFPEDFQAQARHMIEADWLMSYTHYNGLGYTFLRLQRRISQPDQLENVLENLQSLENELERDFLDFFPDLMDVVDSWCSEC